MSSFHVVNRARGRVAKVILRGQDGKERVVLEGVPNLITNTGLDSLCRYPIVGSSGFFSALQVGSGNTPPSILDTQLVSRVAGVTLGSGAGPIRWEGDSFVYSVRYEFPEGGAVGVLSELGVSWGVTGVLNTRTLFSDGAGNPVSITVLPSEQLIVLYELWVDVSLEDSVLVTTTGPNDTEYTLTLRPSQFGSAFSPSANSAMYTVADGPQQGSGIWYFYSGSESGVGPLTGSPTGTSESGGATMGVSTILHPYTVGSYTRGVTTSVALTSLPFNGKEVGAMRMTGRPLYWQLGISPRITKTSQEVLEFDFSWTWARG